MKKQQIAVLILLSLINFHSFVFASNLQPTKGDVENYHSDSPIFSPDGKKIAYSSNKNRTYRIWIMDRGIPTEEVLQEMRESEFPVRYLVGTPRGHLTRYEAALSSEPWDTVRENVRVKFLSKDKEMYPV